MNFAGKKVLVTGGAGFIGSNLVIELQKLKAKIIVVDLSIDPRSLLAIYKPKKNIRFESIDVKKGKKVSEIFLKYKPEYVFHLAAKTIVDESYNNPSLTFTTNVIGTVNILEAVRKTNSVKAVVIASSDKAYGDLKKGKYFEENPLRGEHPYDCSKSAADLISYSYFKTYNVPVIISRFANVYGEGDLNFSRIIPGIMKSIIENKVLKLRSDGSYLRDYLYINDVVRGYLLLASKIDSIRGEAFNFGSDETVTVIELIKQIEEILQKKIKFKIINNAKSELPYQTLDYSKITRKLGWKPKWNLNKSLKNIFQYYQHIV